mmetsp:Transcript_25187/g.62358  ORF Transcript_25187/g.62358 Transcript_25187/m.62358 type:complete len:306 (-) Transcript_25187:619-1536(-)
MSGSASPPTFKPSPGMTLLLSGSAGILGWLPVHPFDVLKIRMQLNAEGGGTKLYKNSVDAVAKIFKTEGLWGLYSGLSAGITRQATYTTLRGGLYQILRDRYTVPGANPTVAVKLGCGLTSGAIASVVCCPVEVSLVRMQADGRLPVAERRGYTNVFNALYRIAKEEGILTCWRGSTPTVARAMVVNMVQFGSYDQAKEVLMAMTPLKGVGLHFSASLISGFTYSAASLPFDIAKTRMQNQKTPAGEIPQYRNIFQTMWRIGSLEGPLSLWKGFWPYFGRGGGHSIFMFLWLEQLKLLAHRAGYA